MNPEIIKLAKVFISKRAELGSKLGNDETLRITLTVGIHECAQKPTVENYAITLMVADEILRRAGETSSTVELPITYSE